jgi:putative ABC transport system ATP-binding protein
LHGAGSTIIVVTHSPEVAEHAERIVQLEFGRMVRDGAPARPMVA